MTLGGLCEATITISDNAAANLILAIYGGPAALTACAREPGDSVTRLDRTEPELNGPGQDPRMDTASPRAMAVTLNKLVLGEALSEPSRDQLCRWLVGNTTGDGRLRAGLAAGWWLGEKTGTRATDVNDIGVAWPAGSPPLVVTACLAGSQADREVKEATIAAVGRRLSGLVA
jgi:beta-lactamase class A